MNVAPWLMSGFWFRSEISTECREAPFRRRGFRIGTGGVGAAENAALSAGAGPSCRKAVAQGGRKRRRGTEPRRACGRPRRLDQLAVNAAASRADGLFPGLSLGG